MRAPPRPTEAWVVALGRRYLEQRSASVAAFRSWLGRRVREAAAHHGQDPAEAAGWVEASIAKWTALGLLNDAAWAESRAGTLRRRGQSVRAVRAALSKKGIAADLIEAVAPSSVDADLESARKYARSHRLGPWRTGPDGPDVRKRELARLGRRGFSYAVAKAALEG